MSYDDDDETLIQDADIEAAEMNETGNRLAALERRGICAHTSWVGYSRTIFYPGQKGLRPGQVRCSFCNVVFDSDEDIMEASDEALS